MIDQVALIGSVSQGYGAKEPELKHSETDKDLKAAAKDFTSILFSYMFSTMRGNPDEKKEDEEHGIGGGMFSGESVDMFVGFLDQEMGKKFSEQGGNDLVNALYTQLKGDKVFKDDAKIEENRKQTEIKEKLATEIDIKDRYK